MGTMIRGVSQNARFVLADTKDIVQKALDIHKCSSDCIEGFGRVLTAGVLMGATLKGDDILTLRTATNGLLSSIVTTINKTGIKGYISNPNIEISSDLNNKVDMNKLIGNGTLNVIKDMGLKEPYVGVSPITNGDIAYNIAYYYVVSEQIPTLIVLGIDLENEKKVRSAGGYMLQLLPNAEENFIVQIENKIKAIRTITELFNGGMDLKRILHLLYEDMNDETQQKVIEPYEILETKNIYYSCDCNKEKFYKGLITLGKDELNSILQQNKEIETQCQFCGKKYRFEKNDFESCL